MTHKRIHCCECLQNTDAELVSGRIIYPHRSDLKRLSFWRCRECLNYVGCHKNTLKPLGSIPTPKLRNMRSRVHRKLDPIWRSRRMSRSAVYERMTALMGRPDRPFHTALLGSVAEAERALLFAEKISRGEA